MKIPSNKRTIESFQLEKFFDLDLAEKVFRTPDKAFRGEIEIWLLLSFNSYTAVVFESVKEAQLLSIKKKLIHGTQKASLRNYHEG